MKPILFALLFCLCLPMAGQTPTYDELVFEADSITAPYRPVGKNYVFIRSKRGTGGVNKVPKADSILALPITDIVLVFSELNPNAINERETANQERWENLLKTYPAFFQFSTNYKSMCQCKNGGDTAIYRKGQGFYVYFTGKEEPKVEEKKVEEKKVEEKVAHKEPKETKEKETKTKVKETKTKEEPVKEKEEPEDSKSTDASGPETTTTIDMGKEGAQKKAGYTKPKRAKDPKACRQPCYEGGDEDLNAFLKANINLTKKQRRHSKDLVCVLRLQLNFDGSIKKAMITGSNEVLNQQVTAAVKMMNLWNPAVKNGVTVKSEVKMTLKYDRETKGLKPFETMINPRPGPKCKCASDAEIFGSE